MRTFTGSYLQRNSRFVRALAIGAVVLGLALTTPAANAGMGGGAGTGAAGAAAGAGGSGAGGGTVHRPNAQAGHTTRPRRMVWNSRDRRRLARRSGALPGARTD